MNNEILENILKEIEEQTRIAKQKNLIGVILMIYIGRFKTYNDYIQFARVEAEMYREKTMCHLLAGAKYEDIILVGPTPIIDEDTFEYIISCREEIKAQEEKVLDILRPRLHFKESVRNCDGKKRTLVFIEASGFVVKGDKEYKVLEKWLGELK